MSNAIGRWTAKRWTRANADVIVSDQHGAHPARARFDHRPTAKDTRLVPEQNAPQDIARQKVRNPAIAMLVLGVLTELAALVSIGMQLISGGAAAEAPTADMAAWMEYYQKFGIAMGIAQFLLAPIVIFGALKMMKLQSRGLVMTAAILVMLPISSCCCLIGIGVGIWALMTLNQPEVKAAFGPN